MRRRTFVGVLAGVAAGAGCVDRASTGPTETRTGTKEGATPTADRHTADGVVARFRVVDGHAPTEDAASATFEGTGVTVTGTMDPGGCRRPAFGSVSHDADAGTLRLVVATESPYGETATVECGNASYDYRCVLDVETGSVTTVEVTHAYEAQDDRSFTLEAN